MKKIKIKICGCEKNRKSKIKGFAKIDIQQLPSEENDPRNPIVCDVADTDMRNISWTLVNQRDLDGENELSPAGYYILRSSPSEFFRDKKLRVVAGFRNSEVNGLNSAVIRRALIENKMNLMQVPNAFIQIKATKNGEDFNGVEGWLNVEFVQEDQQLLQELQ